MEELRSRMNRIIEQLGDANQELDALADDIWLAIDHTDNEALRKAFGAGPFWKMERHPTEVLE